MIYLVTNQRNLFTPIGYSFCSIEDSLSYLNTLEEVSTDTETTGFDVYEKKLLSIQLGDDKKQFVVDLLTVNVIVYKEILENKLLLLQNAKFDLRFLFRHKIFPKAVYDTFLAERVLTTGIDSVRRSLDVLVYKYCKIELDKTIRGNIHREGLSTRVIKYAADDIKYLPQIKRKQLVKLEQQQLVKTLDLDNKFVIVLAYVEYCGMFLNTEDWKDKTSKDILNLENKKLELDNFILDNISAYPQYVSNQLSLFSEGISCKINWNSPQQVVGFLQSLGVDTLVKDKKTGILKNSIDKKVLELQKNKHPFVGIYIKYSEQEKVVSTYGLNWLNYVSKVTGRIHSSFTQIMNTGRMSSGQKGDRKKGVQQMPNMQNIPSDETTRHCFQAENGNMLVVSDYAGQEQIVLANKSLDKDLLYFYQSDLGDMHSFVASKIFKELNNLTLDEIKKNHKEKRNIAKQAGFAINYGGTGMTISQNIGISLEEGERVYKEYFNAFPGLANYFKKEKSKALQLGYIQFNDVSGRKCFIEFYEDWARLHDEIYLDKQFWLKYKIEKEKNSQDFISYYKPKVREYFMKKGDIERMSLNYPIQGTSSDITKLACIYFFNWIRKNNLLLDVKIVNIVHDEIIAECSEELSEVVKNELKSCMERAGDKFCKTIKLKADPVITKYWTH